MEHVAIDLGARESQICVRDGRGEIVEEKRLTTKGLRKYFGQIKRSRVLLETCAESFAVAQWAHEAGHDVQVVPAMLVRSLGVGSRGLKTDVRDARHLSSASCRMQHLPSVHIPSQASRQAKSVCGLRDALVQARTKLTNATRAYVRGQGMGQIRKGYPARFANRVRELFACHQQPLPPCVLRMLTSIDALNQQIADSDKDIDRIANAVGLCRRLQTVPGVGPLTALRFLAVVDDVKRFPNAHALQSYLGITPGEHSSSDRKRTTGITKAGSPRMRWTLIQAAWSAWRCRKTDTMVMWAQDIALRRGKKVAVTALARKMAGIMYAMWRDGTDYQKHLVHADRRTANASADSTSTT